MDETLHDYLKDESNMVGAAESISFPESEAEIGKIIREMQESQTPITIQGGKTGFAGSAVPLSGHIMNLSHMKRVKSFSITEDGEVLFTVEPGITLLELRKAIQRLENQKEFFWPPEPSEPTATVGGIASTGAKGICSHLYGDSNSYIDGIRIMTAEGSIHKIKRGQAAIFVNGKSIDLLDVYLGGEGMYGVITELILRLIPKPEEIWGICFFFEDTDDGLSFAAQIKDTSFSVEGAQIAAIEYLDRTTIKAIEDLKQHVTKLKNIPDIEAGISALVYIEIHGEQEEAVHEIAKGIMKVVIGFETDLDRSWAFSGELEIDKMRTFLHAAEETAVLQIEKARLEDPRITKLGIDMSLEKESLKTLVRHFGKNLQEENLTASFLGHIGTNILHINIMPKNYGDYVKGRALIEKWAETFPAACGNAIAAHGIGKLKKSLFLKTVSKEYMEDIIQLKKQLDKHNLWNPGNMIEPEQLGEKVEPL